MKQTITVIIVLAVIGLGGYWLFNFKNTSTTNTPSPTPTPSVTSSTEGRIIFRVTDAAANMSNISEVSMTVNKVEVHSESKGWVTVEAGNKIFDLLKLKASGKNVLVTDATIETGTYNQIRLMVDKVMVTTKDNKTTEAKLPSGELKINNQIDVNSNQTAIVSLDFIANESLHVTGQGEYIFAPVVKSESRSNAAVQISSDDNVTVTGGSVVSNVTVGMDINGEVKLNFKLDQKSQLNIDNGVIKIKAL